MYTFSSIIHDVTHQPDDHINGRSLRHIDVSYTNITLSALPVLIRECQYLETLDMTGCKPSPKEMVIDYEASEYFLVGDTLKQYRNYTLTQVSLSFTSVTDAMVGYLVRHCDSIQVLLMNGTNVSDTGVSSIAMHCSMLTKLDLGGCNVTDIGVQALAVYLSTQSNIKKPKEHSYSAFQEFNHKTTNISCLKEIVLSGCRITPTSVCLLAKNCIKLERVVLDGCDAMHGWYQGYPGSDSESFVSARSQEDCNTDGISLTLNRTQIMEMAE